MTTDNSNKTPDLLTGTQNRLTWNHNPVKKCLFTKLTCTVLSFLGVGGIKATVAWDSFFVLPLLHFTADISSYWDICNFQTCPLHSCLTYYCFHFPDTLFSHDLPLPTGQKHQSPEHSVWSQLTSFSQTAYATNPQHTQDD